MTPETLDRMRQALARCTFLPASSQKRFARDVAAIPLAKVTERQRRYVIQLCWRYRRQMPWDLVPSKDVVEMLNRDVVAERDDRDARRAARRAARRPRTLPPEIVPLPLFAR